MDFVSITLVAPYHARRCVRGSSGKGRSTSSAAVPVALAAAVLSSASYLVSIKHGLQGGGPDRLLA